MSDRNYCVLEAADAAEALRLAAHHPGPIHLLLTDIVMPRTSGIELARQLVAERPDLRVLYMSGYIEHNFQHEGPLAPRNAFLQKPFTVESLVRKVRELLDASR